MPIIQDVILEFIDYTQKKRDKPYDQTTVKHALDHPAKKSLRKKFSSYSLLEILETDANYIGLKDSKLNQCSIKQLRNAIDDSCERAPSGKETIRRIYQDFIKYIKEQYDLELELDNPEYNGMTPLERRLTIIKILQDPRNHSTQETLADKFGVRRRIISDDLKILQGDMGTKPLTIFGQELKVEYSKERGVYSSSSSVHPIFLTLNLSQIITILEGLREMESYIEYASFAKSSAQALWTQLSDYAIDHILHDNVASLNLDRNWYHSLENSRQNGNQPIFVSERDSISNNRAEALVYNAKIHKKCSVTIRDTNGNDIIYRNYYISPGSDRETVLLNPDDDKRETVKIKGSSIVSIK